jgi:DNA-binding transcriptional regulator YiaG
MADQLVSNEDVLAEELCDPEFRAEWERTAPARWLAVEIAHYRAEHGLSERQLAEQLGVHQSDVARMELGEHPSSE